MADQFVVYQNVRFRSSTECSICPASGMVRDHIIFVWPNPNVHRRAQTTCEDLIEFQPKSQNDHNQMLCRYSLIHSERLHVCALCVRARALLYG